jgi:hypothetical protein
MAKPKKKLTAAQRAAKKQRKKDFMTVFMYGKQVRVRRPPAIEGMDPDEFVRQNADPIWLHQHGEYEIPREREMKHRENLPNPPAPGTRNPSHIEDSNDLPF